MRPDLHSREGSLGSQGVVPTPRYPPEVGEFPSLEILSSPDGVKAFVECLARKPILRRRLFYRYLPRRFHTIVAPEDIFQESCLEALNNPAGPARRRLENYLSWFKVIGVRAILNARRYLEARRRKPGEGMLLFSFETQGDATETGARQIVLRSRTPGPLELLIGDETLGRVLAAVLSVKGVGSELIVQIDALDATVAEAAVELEMTPNAASCCLRRARREVRARILREGIFP